MMMAIMIGSTPGGICTPLGVAASVTTMAFLTKANVGITFLQWSAMATPIFVLIGIIANVLKIKIFPPKIKKLPYGKEISIKV